MLAVYSVSRPLPPCERISSRFSAAVKLSMSRASRFSAAGFLANLFPSGAGILFSHLSFFNIFGNRKVSLRIAAALAVCPFYRRKLRVNFFGVLAEGLLVTSFFISAHCVDALHFIQPCTVSVSFHVLRSQFDR